jgi:predicted TIM-barrel fold metal-dependent hydrolase
MMGKPPTDALFRAEQSVRAATEAKAGQLAPVDFRNATEKLERSKRAMAAKRYEEARRFAESAQVDAELAEAKAEAEITRQAAQELRRASMAFGLKPGAAWDGDIQRSRQGVNKE